MATSEAELAKVGHIMRVVSWIWGGRALFCCFRQVAQDAIAAAQRRKELVTKVVQSKGARTAVPQGKAKTQAPKETTSTPSRPSGASKRLHETLTPLSADKKTPTTKTPDAKNLKVEEEADPVPKKNLFRDLAAARCRIVVDIPGPIYLSECKPPVA